MRLEDVHIKSRIIDIVARDGLVFVDCSLWSLPCLRLRQLICLIDVFVTPVTG